MNDLVIKNGLVILDTGAVKTDVAVKNEKITEIGSNLEGQREINADGLIVSPGMVDAHVHISEPGGGYRDDWEGYITGTAAAAKGGVTTFIEMPLNQVPATVNAETIELKYKAGKGKLQADVASFGGLVPFNLNGGIKELNEKGVVAYKAFMATAGDRTIEGDFQNVDDYSLYEGMRQIAATGKRLAIHAENAAITDHLGKIAYQSGAKDFQAYIDSRPEIAEIEPIQRAIVFAEETGCRIHICHVATPRGIEVIKQARERGVDVTAETCTHYLYFMADELDDIGPVVKCSPPIRDRKAQEGLWNQLINGDIDFVTSDHSPCTPDLKDYDNIFDAWGGISGLQNNVDILFDEGVQKREMSLTRFAEVIASRPADIFELDEKGHISVGYDADFVLIQPKKTYTLTAEDLEYRNKISPYIGKEIGAQVVKTILRGEVVYSQEEGVSKDYIGRFIKK